MDGKQFDDLAKALGSGTTRRLTLGALVGGALGALGLAETAAKKKKKKKKGCKPACTDCQSCKKKKKKGVCQPLANGTACTSLSGGATCQNGTCTCPTGQTNVIGTCTCPAGLTKCGTACVDTQTDESNCGACGTVCGTNQVCQRGTCFPKSICAATQTGLCAPMTTICGTGAGGAPCACGPSTESNIVCVEVPAGATCATLTPCTSSATCPTGQACVEVGSCCMGTPTHACFPRCPTPTAPRTAGKSVSGDSQGPLLAP